MYWGVPIIRELENHDHILIIQWLAECIQIYLSEFGHSKIVEFNKYIQKALKLNENLTSSQCQEISRKIWYLHERDNLQCALSHLWALIAFYRLDKEDSQVTLANGIITLLLPDMSPDMSNYNLIERYLEAAARIYNEYV